jgi:hypothetical protein
MGLAVFFDAAKDRGLESSDLENCRVIVGGLFGEEGPSQAEFRTRRPYDDPPGERSIEIIESEPVSMR